MIEAIEHFEQSGLPIYIYDTPEAMGAASAEALAEKQIALANSQKSVGMLVMAAPSAFDFYNAYISIAQDSQDLQNALTRTHFFQFDDYPLPHTHPTSFRYLLNQHFFSRLKKWCPAENIHALTAESGNPEAACRDYTALVLESGLDLQIKGIGENGHWGFHEPGIRLDSDPAYITVDLSEENVHQQMRDHPDLFANESDVPTVAFTANVALFMKTRTLIEDNIPQASKAFALVAAYGNDTVDKCVPTSILKRHKNAIVRTTSAAARELIQYRKHGYVTKESFERMVTAMGGGDAGSYMSEVFETMEIGCGR